MIDSAIHRIKNIHPEIPVKWILSRLKYKKNKTLLDKKSANFLNKNILRASSLCQCEGAFRFLRIVSSSAEETSLESGMTFKSASISKFLRGSEFALIMGVTAGDEIIKEIESEIAAGRGAEAVILDAAASEIADCAMDYINEFAGKYILREGLKLTKTRFSPGFGDFHLDAQKIIHKCLEMNEMGVEITDSFQLVPEKSVTSVAGAVPIC